jgi:hypothetical protein
MRVEVENMAGRKEIKQTLIKSKCSDCQRIVAYSCNNSY